MPSVLKIVVVVVAGTLALGGCTESRQTLREGFGREVRADLAAQIADPDAHYKGDPTPGSNGPRAVAAQTRYDKDAVTEPASTSTSSVSTR